MLVKYKDLHPLFEYKPGAVNTDHIVDICTARDSNEFRIAINLVGSKTVKSKIILKEDERYKMGWDKYIAEIHNVVDDVATKLILHGN